MLREETDSPCEDIEDDQFPCDENSENDENKYKPEEKSNSEVDAIDEIEPAKKHEEGNDADDLIDSFSDTDAGGNEDVMKKDQNGFSVALASLT